MLLQKVRNTALGCEQSAASQTIYMGSVNCKGLNFEFAADVLFQDMRVVLKSFMWKTSSSQKKYFRQTLANPTFIFSGTCWPRLVKKKHWCVISSNLLQASAPCRTSFILWQLHLNTYVLLSDVGPCSPSSASSDTSTPELSGLPRSPSFLESRHNKSTV